MATPIDIAHRWANQDFGRNGSLRSGNCSCDETSFYSYSAVIAQWLDKERKVMAISDYSISHTTGRHISWVNMAVPADVTVFRFHTPKGYGWTRYPDVDILDFQGVFKPMTLTRLFITNLMNVLDEVATCKSLDCGNLKWWNEIGRLASIYPEASVNKYLRLKMPSDKKQAQDERKRRKVLRALLDGATFAEAVDVYHGAGTWAAYQGRVKGLKKAQRNRELADKIAKYLGYSWRGASPYTVRQLLALTPSERIAIKFANLKWKPEVGNDLDERRFRSVQNMYAYLGLKRPSCEYFANHEVVYEVKDPSTGEVIYKDPWGSMHFIDLEEGQRKAVKIMCFGTEWVPAFKANPKLFRRRFLQRARICGSINRGIKLAQRYDEGDIPSLSESDQQDYRMYKAREAKEIARASKRDKWLDEQRRRMIEERKRREEERKLKVEEYKTRGVEGFRDLWRDRIDQSPKQYTATANELFMGGNVLLRLNEETGLVETSKNIRLTKEQAKVLWRAVKVWHNDPTKFHRIAVKTTPMSFTAHSYVNDILTVGCHSIAYPEMERMARQLHFA
jgi:hypothetical protein